jgi:subtilisin family serine protease
MGSKVIRLALAAIFIATGFFVFAQEANAAKKKSFRAVKTWNQGYKENWALDRINQVHWRLDGSVLQTQGAGEGITIYVIDTGVGSDDCNGHGTVVASIAAGSEYGVAPSSDVVSVKALDCDGAGTAQDVIAAVEWVSENANPDSSVVNMSLGGPLRPSVDTAVAELSAIMPVVVAAGNESSNACNRSPAGVPEAITVAGYDRNNLRAIFSNYGSCVDIWAPGSAIDGIDKIGARVQWSGTSMSTALVSGAIAFIASKNNMTTKEAADLMMQKAARPYLIDARLNGKSAYSLLLGD